LGALVTEYAIYLDDSGHPADQPCVLVAGFLAPEERWRAFEPRWKRALERYGLGEAFHMTDFEASKRKDRGVVLEHLTSIIVEHTRSSFSCLVNMDGYKKINEVYTLEEAMGTPYAIAARGVMRNFILWRKENLQPNDSVLVFVEEGTKHIGDMEEAFRRDGLPVPQRVPKKHPCVQPGDMLAWEIFHCDELKPIRRSFKNLLKVPYFSTNHGKFLEDNILESCRKMEIIHLRKDMAPDTKYVYHTTPKRPRKRTIK
jgi:hypothetical protein